MNKLIALYQNFLGLKNATFLPIEHEDAMVALAYKIIQPTGEQLILKISTHSHHFFRELYFLKHLAGIVPVPRIIQVVPPEADINGAILMEFLPGALLKIDDFTDTLAYEMGSLLARIHLNSAAGYGDLIKPHELTPDPRIYFARKFEEGFAECTHNLPQVLLEKCRHYYDTHIHLLDSVDGPCITHRDFRPGNVIVNNGKITGIIDWASARAGFAQEDFCTMEHGEWSLYPASKKSFLAGYASVRHVHDYHAMMLLLRLSKAIATIGFTIKRRTWQGSGAALYKFNRHYLETFNSSF